MPGVLTTTMESSHLIKSWAQGHLSPDADCEPRPRASSLYNDRSRSSRETGNKCPSLLYLCCQPRGGGG